MKRLLSVAMTCVAASFSLCSLAHSDGMMIPDEATWKRMNEKAYINEPEQKAVVFFSKGKERLIISPSYSGPASNFAWIVPVPARPKVEILKGAIFHELKDITEPERPSTRAPGMLSAPQMKDSPVQVLERKIVGAYDVSVLKSTDGKALMKWLKDNKYHLPAKALEPINYYVKNKWTFVASRVKTPNSAKGLKSGTLAPISLTFPAKQPIYPLRLSSANPEPFSVLVYLLIPSREVHKHATEIDLAYATSSDWGAFSEANLCATVKPGSRKYLVGKIKYPTLSKLSREELKIYRQSMYMRPEDCRRDAVWTVPGP